MNTKNMANVMQALSAVLDAASFPSQDQTKLVALVQSQQTDQSDDLELAAPAAATYTTHSGGIIDILEDMKEKAEAQLSELRKAEVNNRPKACATEAKATAQCDLEVTTKDLTNSKQQLATAHSTCLQVATDHEAIVAGRKEELSAIAQTQKILQDASSGAVSQT